eukprot:4264183-Pleurochrysis_carterae.AAC.1
MAISALAPVSMVLPSACRVTKRSRPERHVARGTSTWFKRNEISVPGSSGDAAEQDDLPLCIERCDRNRQCAIQSKVRRKIDAQRGVRRQLRAENEPQADVCELMGDRPRHLCMNLAETLDVNVEALAHAYLCAARFVGKSKLKAATQSCFTL